MAVIPAGYKQTEVGVIPEDWEALRVCEFGYVVTGGTPRTEVREYWNGDYPWVTPTDITEQRDMWESERMISNLGLRSIRLLQANSVLVTCIASIGKNAILRSIGGCNQQINAVTPHAGQSSEFLYYLFEHSKKYLLANAGMTATSIISKTAFEQLKFPVAPLSEQRAIATALSDVDALLAKLDQLIAKKRDLKQAAMQQLLTGQSRLPGFSGEWEIKQLGDIAHIKTGGRNNEDKVEGGEYPFFVRSENVERINSYSHDCEAILVPGEGRIGDIFHYINGRFDVHQRVYAITQFRPGVSAQFVYLYMAMNFGAWAMQNTVKATVDSLRLPTFQTFEMRIPPTEEEQTAIATVLSDMDAELAALEARRDKTRALKQGMMQELLTGRIRLT